MHTAGHAPRRESSERTGTQKLATKKRKRRNGTTLHKRHRGKSDQTPMTLTGRDQKCYGSWPCCTCPLKPTNIQKNSSCTQLCSICRPLAVSPTPVRPWARVNAGHIGELCCTSAEDKVPQDTALRPASMIRMRSEAPRSRTVCIVPSKQIVTYEKQKRTTDQTARLKSQKNKDQNSTASWGLWATSIVLDLCVAEHELPNRVHSPNRKRLCGIVRVQEKVSREGNDA
jgi:hypothetical protein